MAEERSATEAAEMKAMAAAMQAAAVTETAELWAEAEAWVAAVD